MAGNDSGRGDSATLWSIVIKAAYRKRRSRRRQEERIDEKSGSGLDVISGNSETTESKSVTDLCLGGGVGRLSETGGNGSNSRSGDNDLLRYLMDGGGSGQEDRSRVGDDGCSGTDGSGRGREMEETGGTESGSSSGFLSELFSVDKLNGGGGSRLSIDCKGDIVLEESSLGGSSGKQMDWLGLMEGRVYINENMAGTSLQPYSGAYKRTKGKRWSAEQTNKFYDALSIFGTDLMLVKSVFPEFTDKQIHDKFKAEEKKNKERMDDILINNKRKLTKEDVLMFKQKYK